MAKTKDTLIKELDEALGLTDNAIPDICAFCKSKDNEFRIRKYRCCDTCWNLFELFKELEKR